MFESHSNMKRQLWLASLFYYSRESLAAHKTNEIVPSVPFYCMRLEALSRASA